MSIKEDVLRIITEYPGLDDIEIADRLGEDAYLISELLQELEDEGLITEL